MAKVKLTRLVSPVGIAKFAYLDKPQEPYKGDGDPKFKVRVLLDDTEDSRAWIEKVLAAGRADAKKAGVKLKKVFKSPFELPEDQDEDDYLPNDEGKVKLDEDHQGRIFFDTKSKYKPGLIDTARESLPDDVKIMGGDLIRVKVEVNPYEGFGGGISLRLVTVQLVEKNTSFSGGTADTDGFDDIDGYVADHGDDEEDDETEDEKF